MKISKIVGLAFISFGIINIILSSINTQGIFIDVSFIICGFFLLKQNNTARRIITFSAGVLFCLLTIILLSLTILGFPDDVTVEVFRSPIILDSLSDTYLIGGSVLLVLALVFVTLRSNKAIEEFEPSKQSV